MRVIVEGSDAESVALARLLAAEGNDVRDLDGDHGPAEIAYLDVWTPEAAPRVQRLRAQGTHISCLGDLLLERWRGPSIGITGTAGKTTTTALVAGILHAARIDFAVSRGARAGNLWPTADLLDRLPQEDTAVEETPLLVELTSSHLAFMHSSPTIAAVISFWPDHLELHGDLARYRAAKETIVRHQRPGDVVVVNSDDASAHFGAATPADLVEFSLCRAVERGAYLDPVRGIVLVDSTGETALGHVEAQAAHPRNALAAAAIAAAAGAGADVIELGIRNAATLPWRAQPAGTLAGVPVIDDGMAATPLKASATLARYPDGSVVLIAGGLNDAGGGLVHASAEEHALLEGACQEIARAARIVIAFGEAGRRLADLLRPRGVEVVEVAALDDAVAVAARHARGKGVVVFSPLFPVTLDDRARFTGLVRRERRGS